MESLLPIVLVALAAGLTQGMTGFGSALVSMAILPSLIGLRVAAPLVALFAGTIEISLLLRYRRSFSLAAIRRLALALVAAIPIGILGLRTVPERAALTLLGCVLCGYAIYALRTPRLPALRHTAWAYVAGFLAGLLGGAYNTSGPPLVVYGHSQRWSPEAFKANLQGLFMVNDLAVILGHMLSSSYTASIGWMYLAALPALLAGVLLGLRLDRRLNPDAFRRVVLVALIVMGVRLILG
jgi:uncharacterized membrane protein YfcA